MCYEVFNRSAADAYLRSARRERLQFEMENNASRPPPQSESLQQSFHRIKQALPAVDWKGGVERGWRAALPHRKPLAIAAGILAALLLILWATSTHLWTSAFGIKPKYRFADKKPMPYLLTFSSDFKSWSERSGQMDTPLENFRLDELGTFVLSRSSDKQIQAQPKEWIVIRHTPDHSAPHSATIPLSHPSLKGGTIVLTPKGGIAQRNFTANTRLGRSLYLLTPDLPKRLKPGQSWKSSVAWLEQIGDWKLYWSGTMTWTFGGIDPANSNVLALSGNGTLQPQVWDSPDWASQKSKSVHFSGPPVQASLLFDTRSGRVIERRLTYQGTLDFSIPDLGRIPWELRVGRRVHGPGRIVLQLTNRTDLHQN